LQLVKRSTPVIILAACTALATRLLWSPDRVPYSDDGLLHLFRTFALDRTIHAGVLYPRWLPDLGYGYGYPIFDFYPPLASYIVETIHLLGAGFALATNATFIGIVALAAGGAYALATGWFAGEREARTAGLLAAATYIFFPYFIINVYIRGALAEALAMALLPWIFWSFHRLILRQTLGTFVIATVCLAGLLLAHSITLVITTPVLGVYVLWEWSRAGTPKRRKGVGLVILAGLATLGLDAFYWLPFLADLPGVRMGQGIDEIRGFFQTGVHFLAPSSLIQPSLLYRYGSAPFALGPASVFIGAISLLMALVTRRKHSISATVVLFGAVAIAGALAMLEPAREVWQRVSLATMVQYPWRVSSLIGLSLALITGSLPIALSHLMEPNGRKSLLPGVAAGLVGAVFIWTALVDLSPQAVWIPADRPTLGELARFEEISGFIGTTTFGEYLPASVNWRDLTAPAAAATGAPAPEQAEVRLVRYGPVERVLEVSTRSPLALSLRAFYSPDWQATVDNIPALTYARTPQKIVSVDVPAGDHRVVFALRDSLVRQMASAASIATVLVLLLLNAVALRQRAPEGSGLLLLLLSAGVLITLPASAALAAVPPPIQSLSKDVSPELEIVGLSIEGGQLRPDGWHLDNAPVELHLEVYWDVKSPVKAAPIIWELRDAGGQTWAQHTQLPRYGTGEPATWVPNEIVQDQFDLPITASIPAGPLALAIEYGDGDSDSVTTIDWNGNATPTVDLPPVPHPLDAQIGELIHLLGYDAPARIRPGASFPFTLYWRTDGDTVTDFPAFVQVLDIDGKVVAQLGYPGMQFEGLFPTSLWVPGRTVTDRRVLVVPANLKPGVYHWAAGMYRYPDRERLPVMTESGPAEDNVTVFGEFTVPMDLPDIRPRYASALTFGSSIRLLGYDLNAVDSHGNIVARADEAEPPRLAVQPGQVLDLKLYWQALTAPVTDYKVFVHIVDADGNVVSQQDQFPDAWRYPTRVWEVGERVADDHLLSPDKLAAGVYRIRVGLYKPESGERLPIIDAGGRELRDGEFDAGELVVGR
jgi:hypothetical protein